MHTGWSGIDVGMMVADIRDRARWLLPVGVGSIVVAGGLAGLRWFASALALLAGIRSTNAQWSLRYALPQVLLVGLPLEKVQAKPHSRH